jgi:hypothetical protein
MPMYRVSVSGDDVEADQSPDDPTPELYFYDFEADTAEQAAAEGADMWRKALGVSDDPKHLQVQRLDPQTADE